LKLKIDVNRSASILVHRLARLHQTLPDADIERGDAEHKMRDFIKRFLMHYGIYRRYPLGRFPALRNAWRVAQP
jgi:hypothetical protein